MKFVIEALGLKVGGGKELALNLMDRLAQNPRHRFVFLVPDLPGFAGLSGARVELITFRESFGLVGRSYLLNHVVRRICVQHRADALLCLGNLPPRRVPCPTVVLMQNAWLVARNLVAERRLTFREKLVIAYGRRRYHKLPDRTHVVVQTTLMRNKLCPRFGIDPRHVAVIPNGMGLSPSDVAGPRRQELADSAGPFTFLCLARYYAHKNLEILLEAMEKLPLYTRHPARCLLTIAPGQHPQAARLLRQVAARGLQDRIINLGPLPRERLAETFRVADALIFPTLLESHSRTYFEAMHFGLPIATSDCDFARDTCRDAAIYFDPLDPAAVARAMSKMMEDGMLRRWLVQNGHALLARAPGWDELAARFVAALECAASGEWKATADGGDTRAVNAVQEALI
jgi:glycosyltransferase involved in cell wall biosynthesis